VTQQNDANRVERVTQIDKPVLVGRCRSCHNLYVATRRSDRFCSGTCRQRNWVLHHTSLHCECVTCKEHAGKYCGRPAPVGVIPVRCKACRRRENTRRNSATRKAVAFCACDGCPDHFGPCGRPVARRGRNCPQCSSARSQQIEVPPGQYPCPRCTILIPIDEELCEFCIDEIAPPDGAVPNRKIQPPDET
jgi:hypothetical protein